MGKLQNGSKPPIQREKMRSSGGLEVISQESFAERLKGMSSACRSCQKERTSSQYNNPGNKWKPGRRKQYSKSKAPVPVNLNDRLRSGYFKRQFSVDGDSDISTRSTDEDPYTSSSSSDSGRSAVRRFPRGSSRNLDYLFTSIYKDVASIPEFVPQSNYFYQASPYRTALEAFPFMFPNSPATHLSPSYFYSAVEMNKASQKNLTGFISVIEKAHKKELPCIEANLSRDFTDAKLGSVLNNVSSTPQIDPELKRKNMAECENVELICNDLSGSFGKLAESSDESDISDKASVVSSSDTLSDDVNDLTVVDECNEHEFTLEELELLAEYTTGAPLIRYDYPQPSENLGGCYTYQYYPYDVVSHESDPQFKEEQLPSTNCLQKETSSPRTSTSSESELLSDVEDGSVGSSSSSRSSSSLSSSSCSSQTPASVDNGFAETDSPVSHSAIVPRRSRKPRPIKRATVSVKRVNNYRNDSSTDPNNFGNDSVYMDLTDRNVSISVMYHTQTAVWPYTDHSLYQALYWPLTTALATGIRFPLRFNNQMLYPDSVTPPDLQKYEMKSPPQRPWIQAGEAEKNMVSATFTVMCYNVLCDKLCTKAMYGYCPTWALNWEYRKKGIMGDIRRGNADIITLQEVETEQYYSMFLPELAQQGYDGIFLPKSRVRTMNSDKEKKSVDGCAIFFRKNKFEKVTEYHVEFSQLATRDGHSNTDTDMINRVSTKDNIAIVAVLRTKPGAYQDSPVSPAKGLSQLLMVSTAHIHWDPQSPDVKLVQTMMLVEELQRVVKEVSLKFRPNTPPPTHASDMCNSIPLLLCGDFNSLPDSGVYEYLSKGTLDTNHKDLEGQNYPAFMKDRNYNGNVTHNFQLASAYKDNIPFTNYTFDFKGVIDYIFYSESSLRLHAVMGLQDEEWFRANKIVGCPHPFVPSDHFPLLAIFSLPVLPQKPR